MPFVKFQTSPKSDGNKGSCAQAINYFAKEDIERDKENPLNGFFNASDDVLSKEQAQSLIEHSKYAQGLKKHESKFFHVMIAFSEQELDGRTNEELMQFIKENFADTYLESGDRANTQTSDVVWCAKIEETRKYKGDDPEVKEKRAKSGQKKDGDNRHVHIIVARKTLNNRKISPLSNHFRNNPETGAAKGGFDQDRFKILLEQKFDETLDHKREKADGVMEKLKPFRPDLIQTNRNMIHSFIDSVNRKIAQIVERKRQQVREKNNPPAEHFQATIIVPPKTIEPTKIRDTEVNREEKKPEEKPRNRGNQMTM